MLPADSPNRRSPVIESPCKRVCTLDPATDLCLGCGRSLAEITAWTRMTDAERAQVMAECARRLETRRRTGRIAE
ncbi:MAG TPA: DUF1289 domain-containing protein [Xanthobacteraceae bacterium]|jgi:hypothetical protein